MPVIPPLLSLLARPALTTEEVERSEAPRAAGPGDYAALADAADAVGVAGLVFKNVARFLPDAPLPQEAAAKLYDAYRATLASNLRRLDAAEQVMAALVARGLSPIVLKGAALVETHYGDPGVRAMGDVDLLFSPDEAAHADGVLESLGYRRRRTPGRERSEDEHYQRCFTRGREVVEVHVALCDDARYPIDLDALRGRARPFSFRGVPARVLDDADHAAYVALHAALHGFILPLSCLADVSILLRRAADPAAVAALAAERARAWRAGTAVYETFHFARAFAGAPITDSVLESLRPPAARELYLRACLPRDRWPAFRFGRSLRVAQALTLFPLMDGGRASYLARYAGLRLADLGAARR